LQHTPRVELPQFDGSNPKLWQRRCEDYFQRWQTPTMLWVSSASDQFVGAAATWLESYLHQHRQSVWTDFVAAVLARFFRNQYAIVVRRLIHIGKITTVEDYVSRFSALMDQISAYELNPDPVHYTTKFIDGLQPGVRILVAIQQPRDLDTAYSLALLYEELGEECGPAVPSAPPYIPPRRTGYSPASSQAPPPPPARWVSPKVEAKKNVEHQQSATENKWKSLRAYRRSKNLCFTCGEKYHRDHQCKNPVQLHVVQEMVEYMQSSNQEELEEASTEEFEQDPHLMMLSAAALNTSVSVPKTMMLKVEIQGKFLLFLVDSGSSSCFIDRQRAEGMSGKMPLPRTMKVKVAGGAVLPCFEYFPALTWTAQGTDFQDDFKILELGSYDGIIGLD
jgi:hypothetical protein